MAKEELRGDALIARAKEYATLCHLDANQYYGKGDNQKPYSFHIKMVALIGGEYDFLIPENMEAIVIAGCWGHDLIEDARQTYNDVKQELGEEVADLVYALTNEKGKTRKERANDKYYEGIRNTPYATYIKLCDRIANAKYSKHVGSRMLRMYAKENTDFYNQLYDEKYSIMFKYLNSLFDDIN